MFIEINTNEAVITVPNADNRLINDIKAAVMRWESRTYHMALPVLNPGVTETVVMAMDHMMAYREHMAEKTALGFQE